jgi:hypothetical protein
MIVPLLEGIGQFDTRKEDGSDYAVPRYSFVGAYCNLNLLFKRRFDHSLHRDEVGGQQVEVKHFVAPLLLYNPMDQLAGSHVCKVHPRNVPYLVIEYKRRIDGKIATFHNKSAEMLKPSYSDSGWKGTIQSEWDRTCCSALC